MKIDKVIFTSSEKYSDYWNINSKVYRELLDVEPVCFLFGKKKNTKVREDYGKVVEMSYIPQLPKLLQITWFKFWYTSQEPDTTWMIGDIDQIPLQRNWFIDNIADIPDDYYIHLNSGVLAANRGLPSNAWENMGGNVQGGVDIPGHYHVAKGLTFKTALSLRESYVQDIEYIVNERRYGLGIVDPYSSFARDEETFYWCAEENYSSEILFKNLLQGKFKYKGFSYNNYENKIDRSRINGSNYLYELNKLKSNLYIDIHCMRSYSEQEESLKEILSHINIT